MNLYHFDKLPVNSLNQKTDSINLVLQRMQYKIDSLERIVNKTEIGTGFFSDVISTNLYMFATIIGLLALVSWGFIGAIIKKYKSETLKTVNLKLSEVKASLDTKYDEIENDLNNASYNINRAMYFASTQHNGIDAISLDWALTTGISILKTDHDENDLILWLGFAEQHCENLIPGDYLVKEKIDWFSECVKSLSDNLSENSKVRANELLTKLNHIAYTMIYEAPPENLAERERDN